VTDLDVQHLDPSRPPVAYRRRLDRADLVLALKRRFRRRRLRSYRAGRKRIVHAVQAYLGSDRQRAVHVVEQLEGDGALRFSKGRARRPRWRFRPRRAD